MHLVKEMQFHEHPSLYFQIDNINWKEEPYIPIDCNFYDEMEAIATIKSECEIVFSNSVGATIKICGHIKTFLNRNGEEFVELSDKRMIRLDKLISVNGKLLPKTGGCNPASAKNKI